MQQSDLEEHRRRRLRRLCMSVDVTAHERDSDGTRDSVERASHAKQDKTRTSLLKRNALKRGYTLTPIQDHPTLTANSDVPTERSPSDRNEVTLVELWETDLEDAESGNEEEEGEEQSEGDEWDDEEEDNGADAESGEGQRRQDEQESQEVETNEEGQERSQSQGIGGEVGGLDGQEGLQGTGRQDATDGQELKEDHEGQHSQVEQERQEVQEALEDQEGPQEEEHRAIQEGQEGQRASEGQQGREGQEHQGEQDQGHDGHKVPEGKRKVEEPEGQVGEAGDVEAEAEEIQSTLQQADGDAEPPDPEADPIVNSVLGNSFLIWLLFNSEIEAATADPQPAGRLEANEDTADSEGTEAGGQGGEEASRPVDEDALEQEDQEATPVQCAPTQEPNPQPLSHAKHAAAQSQETNVRKTNVVSSPGEPNPQPPTENEQQETKVRKTNNYVIFTRGEHRIILPKRRAQNPREVEYAITMTMKEAERKAKRHIKRSPLQPPPPKKVDPKNPALDDRDADTLEVRFRELEMQNFLIQKRSENKPDDLYQRCMTSKSSSDGCMSSIIDH